MGLLARRFEEIRAAASFLSDEWDDTYLFGPQTVAGVRINDRVAFSLPTFWRCVDLLTGSVAQSPKDVVVKIGGRSFPEFRNRPAWLSQPSTDPTFTINDHFSQVALSLLLNGNFFTHVFPGVYDPVVLTVLNPNRVRVRKGPNYEILDEHGQVVSVLGPYEMLHGTWIRPAGELRGINPVSMLSRSLGAAVAAEEFAGRFFGQGATMSFGVEVPGSLEPTQRDQLSDSLRRRYSGLSNSHAIGVLTGGAKFITGLTPTPEQAQMLETRKFAVIETCRPFGVPPVMAGSTDPGAVSYASAQSQIDTMYQRNAVQPLAARIETHYDRLVSVPDTITDPGASAQFRFNLDWIIRTDILTRYQAYGEGVTKGFLKPDEAREREDLPPVGSAGGGDRLYAQQQMVPLGTGGQ